MRKVTLAASLIIAPALVQAQATVQAQGSANASISGASGARHVSGSAASSTEASGSVSGTRSSSAESASPAARRLGADAQARVDANIRAAHERKLPEEPIRQRVAEGEAKGASDAQIAAASGRTLVDMQGAFDAMVRGGHASPSDAEVSRGASLIARGYTSVQLEGIAHRAGSDRSLTTAFDVLTSLQARGVSNADALAQVESQLSAHASDAQLSGLATNANGAASLSGALNGSHGSGAGSAAGSATAGMAGSAAGGVSGTVHGVLGKP